ncbi:MAG: hypothetical protein MJZ76_08520 [Bacteroidales bacterium]|nr:hypothetical protein [Bacteroidales bacterium]
MDELYLREKNDEIRKIFQNSATLIKNLENPLDNEKRRDYFLSLYNGNLRGLDKNDPFVAYVSKNMQRFLDDKRSNFNQHLVYLIRIIASYQNQVIKEYPLFVGNLNSLRNNRPQVFLSYAYVDRGLSLALFYYFLQNNAFLYIDWMWRGDVEDGGLLKYDLNCALCRSEQLLFLRTPNSELKVSGGTFIRQWCAWEIGNYYAKGSCCCEDVLFCRKFFSNLSGNDDVGVTSSDNRFLSTFLPMKKVENGVFKSY